MIAEAVTKIHEKINDMDVDRIHIRIRYPTPCLDNSTLTTKPATSFEKKTMEKEGLGTMSFAMALPGHKKTSFCRILGYMSHDFMYKGFVG